MYKTNLSVTCLQHFQNYILYRGSRFEDWWNRGQNCYLYNNYAYTCTAQWGKKAYVCKIGQAQFAINELVACRFSPFVHRISPSCWTTLTKLMVHGRTETVCIQCKIGIQQLQAGFILWGVNITLPFIL